MQWGQTKKKNAISKIKDLSHIHAPNYRENYLEGTQFNKKMALCTDICETQRSYGL